MRKKRTRTVRDPMEWIKKRTPLAVDQTRDIGLAYHAALEALMGEKGTEQEWATLACALNVALLLAENGICAEAEPMIKLAQEAVMQVRKYALASGEWRINLAFYRKQAILAAVNAHDEQCGLCTRGQLKEAIREVHRRIEIGEVMA